MFNKTPAFKIVGSASKDEEKEAEEKLYGFFSGKHLNDIRSEILVEIEKLEYGKTGEELGAIEFANQMTNDLITTCGMVPYDFPSENIHIFPASFYRKTTGSGGAGRADHVRQAIVLNADKVRDKGNLRFANIVFHEMLHIKSFASFKIQTVGEGRVVALYQRGFEIEVERRSYDEDEIYPRSEGLFGGLNEALITYCERYFISKVLESGLFKEEREWLGSKEAQELKGEISRRENIPEEDIYTVNKNGMYDMYSYLAHEAVLERVVDKIYRDNLREFNSRDEVIAEFLKAVFSGYTQKIATLVNGSFGFGSFKVLGTMKEDKRSATDMLEYFK